MSRVLLTALSVILVACSSQPPARQEAYTTAQNPIQSAQATLARADSASSPLRDSLLVEAAGLFATGGRDADAEQILRGVNASVLETGDFAAYTITYARLALASERYLLARSLLGSPRLSAGLDGLPPEQRRSLYQLRGDLQALLGDDLASAGEYAKLATLLNSPAEIQKAHDDIWQRLTQVPEQSLRRAATAASDTVFAGWLQLALTGATSQGDIAHQLDLIEAWQQAHPRHPAAMTLPTSLRQAAAARGELPARIALLLPHHGEMASAARPLQDGIFAAYYAAMAGGATPPALRLYDTAGGDIDALYDQAVAEGAELVIGPLAKDQLQKLLQRSYLPAPVLGLNFIDDAENPHYNLYQFGLGVGDEALQLAERAWVEGRRSALVVRLDSSWATTAYDTFRHQWESKGGLILTTPPFQTNQQDYASFLRDALLLSDSQERTSRLQRTLGKQVATVPRRRMDVDMVLLLAQPDQGRQIKPTLDFLFAADLPIFASSHIYTGSPNPGLDQDLNGIQFTALPWTIPTLADRKLQPASPLPPAFHNLFSMGVDAYRLHQWLGLLKALPDTSLPGQTGTLALGTDNRITRMLALAAFHNGQVIAAPTVAGSER